MQEYELYGFSLFETFLAKEGTFWRLSEHWDRLSSSAARFGMEAPDKDRFFRDVRGHHDASRSEVIRYTLLQMGGRWTSHSLATETRILKKTWSPVEPYPVRLYLEERPLPARDEMRCHKSGSRMMYQSAHHSSRSRGFDDALFADSEGYLLESSTYSICIRLDGKWFTPPLRRGLLPGVMRAWLIQAGFIQERDIRQDELDRFEAVVATNTVQGMRAVSAISHRMLATDLAYAFIENVGIREFRAV